MVLDTYIKQDFVKQVFMKSCLFVSDINQAEVLAKAYFGRRKNIIFESSYIKYAFFNKLKHYHPNTKIINCDSSKRRLLEEIKECGDQLVIFDKVNYCDDFNIFNRINNMNRILVC